MVKRGLLEKLQENNLTHWEQAPAGYWSGKALNKLESCAYFAVLASMSEEELHQAKEIIKDWPHSSYIAEKIKQTLNPTPYNVVKKNETIDTLLKWYTDKKSKKVGESKKELKKRFPYQSFAVQKKIIKAFLTSRNIDDAAWGARQADIYWDKSFIKPLEDSLSRGYTPSEAKTIIRHFPLDFVSLHRYELHFRASEDLCIRLGDESDFDVESYDLNILSYLYVYAHLKSPIPKTESEIEKELFFHIYKRTVRDLDESRWGPGYNFADFPELRKGVWALGQLNFPNIVLKILACQEYILANKNDNTYSESIRLARKWIEEVWDIDDKQFLRDFVDTYKEQGRADYLALSDLPPDDFGTEEATDLLPKFDSWGNRFNNEFDDEGFF